MARTINGKLIGRAARTEIQDILESEFPEEKLSDLEKDKILLSVLEGFVANKKQYTPNDIKGIADAELRIAELKAKLTDAPHPVDEPKTQYECENCTLGIDYHNDDVCDCCEGNWCDCDNCHKVAEIVSQYVELPTERDYLKQPLTDAERKEIHKQWNEYFSNEEVYKRHPELRGHG